MHVIDQNSCIKWRKNITEKVSSNETIDNYQTNL